MSRWLFVGTYAAWMSALLMWPDRLMLAAVLALCLRAIVQDIVLRLEQDSRR